MRWILFSILLVVIPPLFVILYRLIVGLDFSYNEYAQDVMTTSVALCCNFLSLCFGDGAKINQFLKWGIGILAGIVGIFAWGFTYSYVLEKLVLQKLY